MRYLKFLLSSSHYHMYGAWIGIGMDGRVSFVPFVLHSFIHRARNGGLLIVCRLLLGEQIETGTNSEATCIGF